jgi:hypothetical protein
VIRQRSPQERAAREARRAARAAVLHEAFGGPPLPSPERRTPIARRRKGGRRRSERTYDADRRAWTRHQPCCARGLPGHRCRGRIEGDHAGERPLGRKASDDTMIALCWLGHRERTDSRGPWASMTPPERRAWCDTQIDDHRQRYAEHQRRQLLAARVA